MNIENFPVELQRMFAKKWDEILSTGKGEFHHVSGGRTVVLVEGETLKFFYYDADGRQEVECLFVNGKLHGKSLACYYNGRKIEKNFENGQLHGKQIESYVSGKVTEIGQWVHGKKDGAWIKYDFNGNELDYETYDNGEMINPSYLCSGDKKFTKIINYYTP